MCDSWVAHQHKVYKDMDKIFYEPSHKDLIIAHAACEAILRASRNNSKERYSPLDLNELLEACKRIIIDIQRRPNDLMPDICKD